MGNQIINIKIFGGSVKKEQKEQVESESTYKVDGWEVKGLEKGLPQSYVEMLIRPTIEKIKSDTE